MSGASTTAARRARAPRDRRVLLLAAAVAAVAIAGSVVALSAVLGRASSRPVPSAPLPDGAAIASVFRGIPQHGLVLGSPAAPVTVVEYLDLQCPYCGAYERDTFAALVARFVRPGKAKVEMRPLDFLGSDSVRGRTALFAAAAQNKAFPFAALLYAHQGTENTGWLSDDMVRAAAAAVPGLDVRRVTSAGPSSALADRIERERAADGITGVPTFVVQGAGPTRPVTLVNPGAAALIAAIRAAG